MTKKRASQILSLVLALTLVFVCMSPSSYAISKQQFGAWIAAALQAISITGQATAVGAADASRDFMDWLSTPVKVVANQFIDVPYTTPISSIDEYLSRSTLQIDKDIVTIDGVEYTDVWLSNEASEKFRVNAFDLENSFDIASQSEGTFASWYARVDGIPFYEINNRIRSQNYQVKLPQEVNDSNLYQIGKSINQVGRNSSNYGYFRSTLSNNQDTYSSFFFPNTEAEDGVMYFSIPNKQSPTVNVNFGTTNTPYRGSYSTFSNSQIASVYDPTPVDFDWVAGTIPADEVLPENEGIRIRVPTEDIADWYSDYPEIGDSVVINMGDPDLEAKVDDLIDIIIPLIPVLDIDFTKKETPAPAPDPEPVPEPQPYPDPLPDPSISLIDSTLKDIVQALKNIYDSIATGNTFSEAIKNLNDKINWSLDDIKEKVGDLANKIETGSADWFRDIVQSIWQPFLPLFNIFRAGVGIWHYVVEWLQYIHEPFVTFWNFLGSAGYIFLSPIYATAAAAIVIAIYRRFGR